MTEINQQNFEQLYQPTPKRIYLLTATFLKKHQFNV